MTRSTSTNISDLLQQQQQQSSAVDINTYHDNDNISTNDILNEINQESPNSSHPPIPMEAMQQYPPSPFPNMNQSHNGIMNEKETILLERQIKELQSQLYDGKFTKIIRELTSNIRLIAVIFISSIILQNPRVMHVITTKIVKLNFPYINVILIALTQIFMIMIGKNLI